MVVSLFPLSFSLAGGLLHPAEKPGEGKRERRSGPRRDRECGRASDRSEADGAKPAEGRNKDCAGSTGSNGNRGYE